MTSARRKGLTGAQASIVVNNYNYGRFLRDAIDSALAQTYSPLEVIVVDDGSTDESRDVIASYGDRIIPVLKPNGGQASTFNAGFEKSKGEVILFLDADDVLLPKAMERAMRSFRPGVVKVHWQLRETTADLRKTSTRVPPERLLVGDAREVTFSEGVAIGLSPPTSGNAWARSFLDRVMPIPEKDFRLGADGYLYGLAPAFGIIARLSHPLSLYRVHGDNSYRHTPLEDRVRVGILWTTHRWRALAAYAREIGTEVNEMNWVKHSYFHQLRDATRDLESVVPPGSPLILMDETRWASGPTILGRPVIPFIERRGMYWGPPENDADAIEELERLRSKRGAQYLVVGWPAFWWLEHYRGFAEYLRSRYSTLLSNQLLIVFDLRSDGASPDSAPPQRQRKRTREKARPYRRIRTSSMSTRIRNDQKVFGIGLSKTGTTSLNDALNLLGIPSIHFPHDAQTFDELARGEYRLSVLNEYQGVTDTPVAPFFAQLDKVWPHSKFILTIREKNSWLRSAEAHWRGLMVGRRLKDPQFGAYIDFISAAVYGCVYFNAKRFAYAYETHERLVREYFSKRPDDLLVLDVFRGQGMPEVCGFLGIPVPENTSFPHVNRGDEWPGMVAASRAEVAEVVPAGETVIVIDEEVIGDELTEGRLRLPFLERDGGYWGNPQDDATAIRELARLRDEAGAGYVVVAWPSFWWLEHYSEFGAHLRSQHRCVLSNDRLIIFDLGANAVAGK